MGQWKVSTLIGRNAKTQKWEVIDGPTEGASVDFNEASKKLIDQGGKVKRGGKEIQYDLIGIQNGVNKRRKTSAVRPGVAIADVQAEKAAAKLEG